MFAGTYLHDDVFSMAAAYLYHIVQSHPFLDGNKRTGAVAALAFLDWNDVQIHDDNDGLVDITLQVATCKADKETVAVWFRTQVVES